MANRYFTNEMLRVIGHPEHWRVVSSFLTPEMATVSMPGHQSWSHTHQHMHPYVEMQLVLCGRGIFGFGNQWYNCSPGTLFILMPGELHDNGCPPWTKEMVLLSIYLLPEHTSTGLCIMKQGAFSGGAWTQLLTDLEAPFPALLTHSTEAELTLPQEALRFRIIAAIANYCAVLIDYGYRRREPADVLQTQLHIINVIQQYIHEHHGCSADLDSLARLSGYSKFHLARLFHRYTGQTIHAYINQCRREYVETLVERGLSKQEMAKLLGFAHLSTFSRWLHQHYSAKNRFVPHHPRPYER